MNLKGERQIRRCVFMSSIKRPVREFHVVGPPKSTIRKSGEKNFGYEARKKPKKPWVTDQLIDKMEERRKWKNLNTEHSRRMYRNPNNERRGKTDKARAV